MNTPSSQTLYSKYSTKAPDIIGEMADSRARGGNEPVEPRSPCCAGKQVSTQRMTGTCEKDTGASLKGLPPAES